MPESAKRIVIALVRHGDYHQPKGVPSALLPYALNQAGIEQAALAAPAIMDYASAENLNIESTLHCSRQQRAWQTASIIAENLGGDFNVKEFQELSERSVGAAANLTVVEIEQLLIEDPRYDAAPTGWKSDSYYCLPLQGAESLVQAGERVGRHIEQVATAMSHNNGADQLKIIVGHGASIRHACAFLGVLDLKMVTSISMYHARPVYIVKEAGVWRVVAGEWKQRDNQSDGDEIRER
jgi:2,3-bisphosphoglycerate-dependent phosphoglycerate mutase